MEIWFWIMFGLYLAAIWLCYSAQEGWRRSIRRCGEFAKIELDLRKTMEIAEASAKEAAERHKARIEAKDKEIADLMAKMSLADRVATGYQRHMADQFVREQERMGSHRAIRKLMAVEDGMRELCLYVNSIKAEFLPDFKQYRVPMLRLGFNVGIDPQTPPEYVCDLMSEKVKSAILSAYREQSVLLKE